jgi:Leucine-rich repeat (LRR) protein
MMGHPAFSQLRRISLLFACLWAAQARATIPASERQALLDLYASTNGAGWTTNTGWNGPPGTECTWARMTCDGGQTTVTTLQLGANNLVGVLPPTIGNLPNASLINLATNNLSGSIPSFAGSTGLRQLWLYENQLSGSIPSFAANHVLFALGLWSNQLTGPIPSFASNTALESLILLDNQLSGPIPSFDSNPALIGLSLDFNQLTGSIPSFAANTALTDLSLSDNQLTGPVPSFAANTALHNLRLDRNQLTGSIPTFAANSSLQGLYLFDNQLSGPIPSFAANPALQYLILERNQLSGSIPSFAANTALRELSLMGNQLGGPIPSFATNTALQSLYLNSNQLTGSVHPSLGTLTNLAGAVGLDLRWNALFSTDATLIAFLNSKQVGGNWQSTQTVPVTGLSISGVLPTQITVNWTPIAYTADTGHYQVFYGPAPGGPYAPFASVTANKSATSLTVTGVTPLADYYFVVQTTTEPHANNHNTVVSGYSTEVTAPPAASIADGGVTEGNFGTTNATFVVSLSRASTLVVAATYTTADISATAGSDYVASSGTITFAPGTTSQTIDVPVIGDLVDESNETFAVTLSAPSGLTFADAVALGTIVNDDPQPTLSASDCAVAEGNAGTTPCVFTLTLSQPSSFTVSANISTASGSATSGSDFVAVSSSPISFAPGETGPVSLGVQVMGDSTVETDETFFLNFTNVVNATTPSVQAQGTILDDDAPSLSSDELFHGSSRSADLANAPDAYRIYQAPFSSYEAVLDGVTGDAPAPPLLQRIGADNVTVLQDAIVSGPGGSHRLSWQNPTPGAIVGQTLRVGGAGCAPACGPDDVYRIRFYDTTYSLARFNNSATQVTVLAIQNPTDAGVSARALFWSPSGVLLLVQPLAIAPRGLSVLNTASISELAGRSGSITITSDAPYGALAGKAVALEPATGFSFDDMMRPRPQ